MFQGFSRRVVPNPAPPAVEMIHPLRCSPCLPAANIVSNKDPEPHRRPQHIPQLATYHFSLTKYKDRLSCECEQSTCQHLLHFPISPCEGVIFSAVQEDSKKFINIFPLMQFNKLLSPSGFIHCS